MIKKIIALELQLTQMTEQVTEYIQNIQSLEKKILQDEKILISMKKTSEEELRKAVADEKQRTSKELQSLLEELAIIKTQKATESTKVISIERANSELQKRILDIESQNEQLKQTNRAYSEKFRKLEHNNEELQNNSTALNEEINTLKRLLIAQETTYDKIKQELHISQTLNHTLSQQGETAQTDFQTIKTELKNAQTQIIDQQKMIAKMTDVLNLQHVLTSENDLQDPERLIK